MLPVLPRKDNLELLRKMLLIRRFEEACIMAADKKQVPGHYHVYIGQEATGVGVCSVLEKGDFVHSTHRNHGHLIARGADPKKALAEILGKSGGYAGVSVARRINATLLRGMIVAWGLFTGIWLLVT